MLCLSGFELYSRWVPLLIETCILIFNGKNDIRTRRETVNIPYKIITKTYSTSVQDAQ